jgi:hypothetical protein
MSKLIDFINYVFNRYPNLIAYLFLSSVLIFTAFYFWSYYTNKNLIFIIGTLLSGILILMPLWYFINFLLLLIYPAKFKEYGMKKRGKGAIK